MEKTMEKIVALAKARGFVYPGSEIYGGLANTWDYGNLGVELKNNVKKAWWQKFVQESPYNVGVDCAILMNPQTWVASGHLGGFSDPLMDCKECHERFRADKLIEDFCEENGIAIEGWYPLGGRGYTAAMLGNGTIGQIAKAHGKSPAQIILRWDLQNGIVIIPGSSNPDHQRENISLFDFELSSEEMAQIAALDRNEKHDWY